MATIFDWARDYVVKTMRIGATSKTGARKATLHASGTTIFGVGTASVADGDLGAGEANAWIDETGHTLNFKVKYSDGTTVKSGSVSLS